MENLISKGDSDNIGLQDRIGDSLLKVINGSIIIFKVTKRIGIYVTKYDAVLKYTAEASNDEFDPTLKWLKIRPCKWERTTRRVMFALVA